MRRNPLNPKDYIKQEPKKRSEEKLEKILFWLVQFHYSTRKVLLQMLKLNSDSHHYYFKNLEEKKILKKTKAYTIKSDIYLLTPIGKELASEKTNNLVIDYSTETTRINHSALRHNLAVQKTIVSLFDDYLFSKILSEKYLSSIAKFTHFKKPDALLENESEKTVLEVELTAKSDRRIFKAFSDHAKSLTTQCYHKILYVFPTETLKNYYKTRFDQATWPQFTQNEKGLWVRTVQDLNPDCFPGLRDCFNFVVKKQMLENI